MATTADQDTGSKIQHDVQHDVYDEKSGVNAFKAGAIEAENAEHNMTVLEAVRAYPMASFWAFVMSCTIVSCCFANFCSSVFEADCSDHGIVRCLPYG